MIGHLQTPKRCVLKILIEGRIRGIWYLEECLLGGFSSNQDSVYIVFGCVYGQERKSKVTEKRPNQYTKKKEGAARLNFQLGADGLFRLKGFNEEHNHLRTHSTYLQETERITGAKCVVC